MGRTGLVIVMQRFELQICRFGFNAIKEVFAEPIQLGSFHAADFHQIFMGNTKVSAEDHFYEGWLPAVELVQKACVDTVFSNCGKGNVVLSSEPFTGACCRAFVLSGG